MRRADAKLSKGEGGDMRRTHGRGHQRPANHYQDCWGPTPLPYSQLERDGPFAPSLALLGLQFSSYWKWFEMRIMREENVTRMDNQFGGSWSWDSVSPAMNWTTATEETQGPKENESEGGAIWEECQCWRERARATQVSVSEIPLQIAAKADAGAALAGAEAALARPA
jgi:hypothetical protein